MHLATLDIIHFKNYSGQKLDFSPTLNCFVGKNGMGKTNLLDAIYYLCMTKSPFGLNDRVLLKHEEDFFRLVGKFEKDGRQEEVIAKVQPRKMKVFERNKVPYERLADHIGLFPVVMIAPDDTRIATEGSEERRRFLDNTLCQIDPKYLEALIQYNKVLSLRNKQLKQFAEHRTFDELLIKTYDQQLLAPAEYILAFRIKMLERFIPIFTKYYQIIAKEQEGVDCMYLSKLKAAPFEDLLSESLEKDRILQRTTVGIHKDDLEFTINEFPLKRYASQGQLKSFVLALKLAQYHLLKEEKGSPPLLLLDDIFDKLDAGRVKQLLELLIIEGDFGQVFITDTHEDRVEQIVASFNTDYKKYVVQFGKAGLMQ